MPVHILASAVSSWLPSDKILPAVAGVFALTTLKGWAGGVDWLAHLEPERGGPGERDLHARVVLVVGGFSPLGLVVLSQLAARGAQIIALTPTLASPRVQQLVQLLRDSTNNQLIYAEECDILDPHSVTSFAETWNKGATQGNKSKPIGSAAGASGDSSGLRLDAIIFLPLPEATYSAGEGLQRVRIQRTSGEKQTEGAAWELAHAEVISRYHFVQSMLSSLLLLPPDRDIRIISTISPWLPTGVGYFSHDDPDCTSEAQKRRFPTWQPWVAAGAASLRWLALSKELQHRIQLLAEADQRPVGPLPAIDPNVKISSVVDEEVKLQTKRRANINVINVSLGFERNADVLPYILPPYIREEILVEESDEEEGTDANAETTDELTKLKARVDPRLKQRPKTGEASARTRAIVQRGSQSYSALSIALRYLLAAVLWPFIWLFAKSPSRAANGVTWALVAPLERPQAVRLSRELADDTSTTKGPSPVSVRPVDLYREGLPRPVVLPSSVRDQVGQRKLWELEESLVKQALRGGSKGRKK